MRDGKAILVEKESSGILPNADGTYYMQSSLEISLQEEDRHRYACRVHGDPATLWQPESQSARDNAGNGSGQVWELLFLLLLPVSPLSLFIIFPLPGELVTAPLTWAFALLREISH
ncbi:hypothetical protein UY3_17008 [Chelonia mydas]|uniref:Ig-like domain-containing protein n=1 Tax=Chelonia mydas TaxID=8469 RepID=M7AN22_CHEMY|nr:hypothetical protein UY3_17008 [Chelonia mydas]